MTGNLPLRSESILQFIHQEGWYLFDEYGDKIDPDLFWNKYVAYYYHSAANYEHVTAEGLRFAIDADFS